jgi:hypothetical protein
VLFSVGRAVRATSSRPWLVDPAQPSRCAVLLRSRTSRYLLYQRSSHATHPWLIVRPTWPDRFDEILYIVEKASDLTLARHGEADARSRARARLAFRKLGAAHAFRATSMSQVPLSVSKSPPLALAYTRLH